MSGSSLSYDQASWMRRLKGHLSLARISNSPTVVTNVLAGAALGGATGFDHRIALIAGALFLFYTAGMYLNDVCDLDVDRRHRPERPLPAGLVAWGEALASVVFFFIAGALLLFVVGTVPFISGLFLIGLIVLYDLWHKTNPLSPFLMAGTRALVYATAFVAFAQAATLPFLVWTAFLFLYIVALTYIAKVESMPGVVRFWPALILFLPAAAPLIMPFTHLQLFIAGAFVVWVAYSIRFVYRKTGKSFGGAVARLLAGICLLDGIVLASLGSLPGVAIAIAGFGLTLYLQRFVSGT